MQSRAKPILCPAQPSFDRARVANEEGSGERPRSKRFLQRCASYKPSDDGFHGFSAQCLKVILLLQLGDLYVLVQNVSQVVGQRLCKFPEEEERPQATYASSASRPACDGAVSAEAPVGSLEGPALCKDKVWKARRLQSCVSPGVTFRGFFAGAATADVASA